MSEGLSTFLHVFLITYRRTQEKIVPPKGPLSVQNVDDLLVASETWEHCKVDTVVDTVALLYSLLPSTKGLTKQIELLLNWSLTLTVFISCSSEF